MIKHREILRMANLGLSQRNIAGSLNCSRTTVAEVLRRAREEQLTWPLPPELSDPELAKKGVTRSLLWSEYCEECQSANTPTQKRS